MENSGLVPLESNQASIKPSKMDSISHPDWRRTIRVHRLSQRAEFFREAIQRLDVRFDERLKEIYERTMNAKKWQGTAAVHDRVAYWAEGVLAYFDASGQDAAPPGALHPIRTRQALQELPRRAGQEDDGGLPDQEIAVLAKEPVADHAAVEYVRLYNLSTDPPSSLA